MIKRKLQIVVLVCLLAILVFCIFGGFGKRESDEATYRNWARTERVFWMLNSAQKRLPGPLVSLVHVQQLKERYRNKANAQEEALLGSGYLTSVSITVTNGTETKQNLGQITSCLRKALQGADAWSFYMASNQVVITCRTKDVPLCRQALKDH